MGHEVGGVMNIEKMGIIYSIKIRDMHPKENIPYKGDTRIVIKIGMDKTLDWTIDTLCLYISCKEMHGL
jgi:hypothetical protein